MVVFRGAEDDEGLAEREWERERVSRLPKLPQSTPPILGRYDFMTFFCALVFALLPGEHFLINLLLIQGETRVSNLSSEAQCGA